MVILVGHNDIEPAYSASSPYRVHGVQARRVPEAFYRVRTLKEVWGTPPPLHVARGEALCQKMVFGHPKGLKYVLKTLN